MNSWRIIIFALAGGLGVGLAELLFRGKTRSVGYWVTAALSVALLNGLADKVILPRLEVEQAIRDNPTFVMVEKIDPAAGTEIKRLLLEVSKGGDASGELKGKIRHTMAQALMKHGANAGNAEAIAMIQVTIEEAEVLKANPAMCHRFFFPSTGPYTDYTKVLDKKLLDRESAVVEAALRTVAENPSPAPKEADVSNSLQSVAKGLEKQGINLEDFTNGNDPRADHEKVCNGTIAFYRGILSLPVAEQGPLLRFLFSSSSD